MGGLVCGAVLLIGRLAVAQNLGTNSHGSVGRLDRSEANLQAIARETAEALEGRIEQPAMTPTRSSFLAKWPAAPGATGYRLDVSTTPSFDSYVPGYEDRELGNVTSHIVTGLERGTQYYYRIRPHNSAGTGADSETMPAATANTASGLVINPIFDSTITSDPRSSAIQAMIISAIETYQTLFSDPITVQIRFRFSDVDATGKPMENLVGASNTTIYGVPWDTYITALKADAKTANDMTAIASLPTSPLTPHPRDEECRRPGHRAEHASVRFGSGRGV